MADDGDDSGDVLLGPTSDKTTGKNTNPWTAPKIMTRNMTLKNVLNTYDVDALSTTMPRIVDSAPCMTGMPSAPSALRMRWFPVSLSSSTKA